MNSWKLYLVSVIYLKDKKLLTGYSAKILVLLNYLLNFFWSQVNFYTDHTKVILSKSADTYLLTYISRERISYSYSLNMLSEHGCSSELRHRLHYVVQLLQHYTKI